MYVDTLDHFAGVAEKKAGLLRNNPSSFFIGSMMAGAYVGLGIILIFTLGTFVEVVLQGRRCPLPHDGHQTSACRKNFKKNSA